MFWEAKLFVDVDLLRCTCTSTNASQLLKYKHGTTSIEQQAMNVER